MLKLTVYGSSSKGNCYVLENNDTKIMLDCGVKKLNEKIDFTKIDGILLTHSHNDHVGGIKDVKDYYKGKYYSNQTTTDILPVIDEFKVPINEYEKFDIGSFRIVAFELVHDTTCYGYLIRDMISNTKFVYITDTGEVGNIHFKDIDYFLIEANNDEDLLTYEDFKEQRLYNTHLSWQQTGSFLFENVNHNTKKIMLCHISREEQDYTRFKTCIDTMLNDFNVEVIALNPKLKEPLEITLKKDFDIEF